MNNVSDLDAFREQKKLENYRADQKTQAEMVASGHPSAMLSREAKITKLHQDLKTCEIIEANLPTEACFDCHAPTFKDVAIDKCSIAPIECSSCLYAPCVGLCE